MTDISPHLENEAAVLIAVATPTVPFERVNEYLDELAF